MEPATTKLLILAVKVAAGLVIYWLKEATKPPRG